jgi:hypothetical protein
MGGSLLGAAADEQKPVQHAPNRSSCLRPIREQMGAGCFPGFSPWVPLLATFRPAVHNGPEGLGPEPGVFWMLSTLRALHSSGLLASGSQKSGLGWQFCGIQKLRMNHPACRRGRPEGSRIVKPRAQPWKAPTTVCGLKGRDEASNRHSRRLGQASPNV